MEELENVIRKFKNNKAPGPSGVPIEAIKLLDEPSKILLLALLNKNLRDHKVSSDMNLADLAVIFKKGLTDLPINYRPIALLNLSYKLLASILQKRIALGLDHRLDPFQFGFRKARSTLQP
eukprot:15865629-Heterocapsa_arctica.AAC.1